MPSSFGSGSNDWRRMRWVDHVARMGEENRCRSVVVGILKARDHLERIGARKRIILKIIVKKVGLRARTALTLILLMWRIR
jgi:hypothetical protein